jgi:CRISPR-associated protein Cas1
LQTAVAQLLTRLLDPGFDDASFGYRSGRSVQQATARIRDCRNLGLRWVVDADIRDYFDRIDHPTMLAALRRSLPDGSLIPLLAQWLATPVQVEGQLRPRRHGVPQGSPASPLLANLYLHPLDRALTGAGHTVVRYADDFLVLCHSRVEAEAALALTRARLAALKLELNEEKSRLTHFEAGFNFLGVRFEGERMTAIEADAAPWILPSAAPLPTMPPTMPPLTPPTTSPTPPALALSAAAAENAPSLTPPVDEAVELADPEAVRLDSPADGLGLPRSVYITTQGVRVTKQGERLLVSRGQDAIARIPLRQLDQIVIHGNAVVSTAIIRHCQDNRLGLAFADANGIRPAILDTAPDASLALLKAQARVDGDPAFALPFARACVQGKLHNCQAVLRRFARRESPDSIAQAISILGRTLQRLARIDDLDTLRGHEGRAARVYFAALAALLPESWPFNSRNRQPPRDPVNALLSYGYAVLSHSLQTAVLLARLHPGFGHLHAGAQGRPALVCDLMEEFRPLVVDAVVLTLARSRRLNPQEDFVVPDKGEVCCRIQPAAKQLLIARLEAKLAAPVACADATGKASLHRVLRAQVARYAGALNGGGAYRPYLAP